MRRMGGHPFWLVLAAVAMVVWGSEPGQLPWPIAAEAAVAGKAADKAGRHKPAVKKKKKGRQVQVGKKRSATVQAKDPRHGKKAKRLPGGKTASRKRCEPQSLTYARQRSGNMSSRNGGENGPITWFVAEKKLGKTTEEPLAGSVLILDCDRGHGMPTGHVMYVENVIPEAERPSIYRIIFSHTNYDRRCNCETNIEAFYNRSTMTLDISSGAWQAWGRNLKVAGFIRT